MRLLLVGDPHVTVDELEDSQALVDFVYETVLSTKCDACVILGDLFHNHAVLRVEVLKFWHNALKRLGSLVPTYVLVGNHDRPNDASITAHALQTVQVEGVRVVDGPVVLGAWLPDPEKRVLLLPYYHNLGEFVAEVRHIQPQKLICHQTFAGSTYDNGFYAPDGVDPAKVGVPQVVSGHIHTKQLVTWPKGWVQYVGSPRWRTMSDANVQKDICLWDTETGVFQSFDTSPVCEPVGRAVVRSVDDLKNLPFINHANAVNHLDLVGPKSSLEGLAEDVKKLSKSQLRFRFVPNDTQAKAAVTESEGVSAALKRFVGSITPPYGTPPEVVRKLIAERLHV